MIKRNFLAGLLVLLPISLTIYVIVFLFKLVDRFLDYLPTKYNPQTYLPFHVPGLGFILLVFIIFFIGLLARNYIGHKLVDIWEQLVGRIPFIRSIYIATKQLAETIFLKTDTNLKRVVLIEYPRKGLYVLGFTTGITKGEIQDKTHKKVINVFIPTTPNPTSGFYLLVPEEDLKYLEMAVEDAFKLLISGGIITPEK
ncbi:MAG: hypothetical protein AMJ45_01105 [Syntrophobacter sp. DG_60]|nr:MAG: hypothetical protein AMJ45_01105 [Syntrophobacter sp. DG_60]